MSNIPADYEHLGSLTMSEPILFEFMDLPDAEFHEAMNFTFTIGTLEFDEE